MKVRYAPQARADLAGILAYIDARSRLALATSNSR